jgi:hypothetical protein
MLVLLRRLALGGKVTTYQRMTATLLFLSAMAGGLVGILNHL